jgi:dTDP-4-dehydrorhamnose reductase
MKTILLIGRNGQVGWELERSLQSLGTVVACAREEADLGNPEQLRSIVKQVSPDVVVNAGAYTAVDAAESNEALAYRINAEGPATLAAAARDHDAWLIHYSTDYVFDGKNGPYVETDPTNPLNVYGRTKRAGEVAIERSGCSYLIFRSSWVYGARGHNFLKTILRLAGERELLTVVDDQIGVPTWSRTIADTTGTVLARLADRGFDRGLSGIYHLASAGETTWYHFAELVVQQTAELRDSSPRIQPISSAQYSTPAQRPADSRLDTSRLYRTFGITLPDWRSDALLCLEELKSAGK